MIAALSRQVASQIVRQAGGEVRITTPATIEEAVAGAGKLIAALIKSDAEHLGYLAA
ncbi:MAG: hypothetical protein AAB401_25510 [Acidobacteriota bacterium]